jgi:uncharacterized Zn finger protein
MEDIIRYECLRCGEAWHRPESKEPFASCPGCGTVDYDSPRPADNRQICVVCDVEYPGRNSAHSNQGVCSRRCRDKLKAKRDKKVGVWI